MNFLLGFLSMYHFSITIAGIQEAELWGAVWQCPILECRSFSFPIGRSCKTTHIPPISQKAERSLFTQLIGDNFPYRRTKKISIFSNFNNFFTHTQFFMFYPVCKKENCTIKAALTCKMIYYMGPLL